MSDMFAERLNLVSRRGSDPRLHQWLFGLGRRDEPEVKTGALSLAPAAAGPSGLRGPGRCLDKLIFGEVGAELEM